MTYRPYLQLGLVQTTLDASEAWKSGPRISKLEEHRACEEIKQACSSFYEKDEKPDIILIPELSTPRGYIKELERHAIALNAVIIAGVDYSLDFESNRVQNNAIVIVPNNWNTDHASNHTLRRFEIGKTYGAPEEISKLKSVGWDFHGDPHFYLLDAGSLGRIGICICFDFTDVERPVLYQGQVHHFFVLAYNRDTNHFRCLAEAISRTMYCNTVVCNTGFYGGSVAVSPYYEPWKRTIYGHDGANLLTSQIIRLPVADLDASQSNGDLGEPADSKTTVRRFKHLPARFRRKFHSEFEPDL